MRKRKCACCGEATTNYIIINNEEIYICENGHVHNKAHFVPTVEIVKDVYIKRSIAHCDICGMELHPKDFIMNAWIKAGYAGKPICDDCYFK